MLFHMTKGLCRCDYAYGLDLDLDDSRGLSAITKVL
jgi:hypothetical protein